MEKSIDFVKRYQQEWFKILENFSMEITGKILDTFSSVEEFLNTAVANREANQEKYNSIIGRLENDLKMFYLQKSAQAFLAVKDLDACKLNMGGSTRFLSTHLNATKSALLFSDVVLISDPIMPWFETQRDEEKSPLICMLEQVFYVLQLKSYIFNDFDIPPVIFFPSWEKTLENHDQQTQENIIQMFCDFYSCYVDSGINNTNELYEYILRDPIRFLAKVESTKLCVSQGGEIGESLTDAISRHKKNAQESKTEKINKRLESLPDEGVVLTIIGERLQHQYHMLENANELKSHPFLCIEAQAHYYKLVSNMNNSRVIDLDVCDK